MPPVRAGAALVGWGLGVAAALVAVGVGEAAGSDGEMAGTAVGVASGASALPESDEDQSRKSGASAPVVATDDSSSCACVFVRLGARGERAADAYANDGEQHRACST